MPPGQSRFDVDVDHRKLSAVHVDLDDIAVPQRGKRSANGRLRRDVADHQPLRRTRETPVGDHRHGPAEALTHDGRRDRKHLAHPRSAARALIPNHDRIAGFDPARIHGRKSILFPVEHSGGTAVGGRGVLRDLHHRPLRSKVAAQDDQASLRPQRFGEREDNDLPSRLLHGLAFLTKRAAGDRHRVAVDEAAFDQPLRQQGDAPGLMELHRGETTTRLEIAQQRRAPADPVDIVDREVDADLTRQREQMQDRVGGASARGDGRDRVVKGAAGEDL